MSVPALALLLVQMCVGEIDFPEHPDECRLMWGTMADKARGDLGRLPGVVRRYNSIFKRPDSARGRWVLQIDRTARRPASFPASVKWDARIDGRGYSRRLSVERMLRAADDFVRRVDSRHEAASCRPDHYGGDPDDERGAEDLVPAHWRRLDCSSSCGGDCAQAYWKIGPRTLPAELAAGPKKRQ